MQPATLKFHFWPSNPYSSHALKFRSSHRTRDDGKVYSNLLIFSRIKYCPTFLAIEINEHHTCPATRRVVGPKTIKKETKKSQVIAPSNRSPGKSSQGQDRLLLRFHSYRPLKTGSLSIGVQTTKSRPFLSLLFLHSQFDLTRFLSYEVERLSGPSHLWKFHFLMRRARFCRSIIRDLQAK